MYFQECEPWQQIYVVYVWYWRPSFLHWDFSRNIHKYNIHVGDHLLTLCFSKTKEKQIKASLFFKRFHKRIAKRAAEKLSLSKRKPTEFQNSESYVFVHVLKRKTHAKYYFWILTKLTKKLLLLSLLPGAFQLWVCDAGLYVKSCKYKKIHYFVALLSDTTLPKKNPPYFMIWIIIL